MTDRGQTSPRNHRIRRRIARGALAALALAGGAASRATEPVAPLQVRDAGQGFVIGLVPTGLQLSAVSAHLVFNRYAGAMVDTRKAMVGQYPVSRTLTVTDNRDGTFSVDASPIAKGQPLLPDGIYSQLLVLEHTPAAGYQRSVKHLYPIYFQVVGGVPSRISMADYSARLEPETSGKDRAGQTLMFGKGVKGSGLALPAPKANAQDQRLEDGSSFATPGDERGEN
jgi:hypothetical protein